MKPMTRVYPKLRLQQALGDPRGLTVETAVQRGDARMGEHRAASFEVIDGALGDLRRLCATRDNRLDALQVFAHAETIVDLAGLFSPAICRAAQSLCTLASAAAGGDGVERAAIVVHVEALQLLRSMEGEETPQTDAILQGLLAVSSKAKG